jgi:hypothetical protein
MAVLSLSDIAVMILCVLAGMCLSATVWHIATNGGDRPLWRHRHRLSSHDYLARRERAAR